MLFRSPKEWPEGKVSGLRARGGFNVDITWRGGKLTSATLRSMMGNPCVVRYGAEVRKLDLGKGKTGEWVVK